MFIDAIREEMIIKLQRKGVDARSENFYNLELLCDMYGIEL